MMDFIGTFEEKVMLCFDVRKQNCCFIVDSDYLGHTRKIIESNRTLFGINLVN